MYPIWYKEKTLETPVTTESQVTIASDHTLYAKWIESETSFEYTGDIQTYTPSITGIYKLEVWGAGGYSYGGKGGYSVGYAQLSEGETLYIGVGGTGTSVDGGYNGGGPGNPGEYQTGSGGGGGTHIAKMDGTIASIGPTNLSKILIVAGGGGGGSKYASGTLHYGGDGGGLEGGTGSGQAATQSGGYQFGQSGSSGNAQGGGGGLYGASSTGLDAPGGSGYIGGVPEFTYNGTTYSPSTTLGGGSGSGLHGQARITFVE